MNAVLKRFSLTAALTIAVILQCIQPTLGQIELFDDPERFSEDSVELQPLNFRTGSVIEQAVSIFGVSFRAEGRGRIVQARNDISINLTFPLAIMAFRNEGVDGEPPEGAMIVDFQHPLRRIGFELGNGDPDTSARIEAFNPRGGLIGSIEVTGIDEKVGPFVGIEALDPSGIAKLVIDYGESNKGEQISSVRLDYLTPRPFRLYLPHVGQGTVGGARLQTSLRIVDLGNRIRADSTRVRLDLFDDDGAPLPLTLNGETSSSFEFLLPPLISSVHLRTDAGADFMVGYACVESKYPVGLDAIFRTTVLSTGETFEAGIDARPAALGYWIPAELVAGENVNAAVSLVNGSNSPVDVNVAFWRAGEQGGELIDHEWFLLGAGARRAFFLEELLNELQNQSFQGVVRISSSADIYVTALRTRRGVAESSVAPGVIQVFENPR